MNDLMLHTRGRHINKNEDDSLVKEQNKNDQRENKNLKDNEKMHFAWSTK